MTPPTVYGAVDPEASPRTSPGDVVDDGDPSECLRPCPSIAVTTGFDSSTAGADVWREGTSAIHAKGQAMHQLGHRRKLLSCIRLLDAGHFSVLAHPLPRAQDIPSHYYHAPSANDEVISISHAWRNQAHPDPTGKKTRLLSQLLSQMKLDRLSSGGSMLLFMDFISIPQRPFRRGQEPRTEHEQQRFRTALGCMHEIFFYSDRIIHLPWDDSEVAGEGTERVVAAVDLEGAPLAQTGDCVQILGLLPPKLTALGAQLFDQVVAVDGDRVTSVDQVETLLKNNARSASVRLRCYPYGLNNHIPADDRGWVFLERFITMVKCAMVDEETAKRFVITPSEAIFKQIMDGATLLRCASIQDQKCPGSGALKLVLESFKEELQRKHFSPASTDMREMRTGRPLDDDRAVVFKVMHHFVEHLAVADQWAKEAARQQGLARRLQAVAAAAESFLLDWECFSEEYGKRLDAASVPSPWPIVALAIWPTACVLAILLAPYGHPDDGWKEQIWFWAYGFPVGYTMMFTYFSSFILATVGARVNLHVLVRLAAVTVLGVACMEIAPLVVAVTLDNFPVAGTYAVGTPTALVCLPLIWFCIPRDQRASPAFRQRLLRVAAATGAIICTFGFAFIFLNGAILVVGEVWQAVLVTFYLATKLVFEYLGVKLSHHLGADAMPYFVFLAAWNYQVNLCTALCNLSSWSVVAEQIIFDVIENAYHIWCMFRQDREGPARHSQYILSSLVLREFVEILVPAIFLVVFLCLRRWRPESTSMLCRDESSLRRTVHFLEIDIAVEAAVSCITWAVLRRKGHKPLLMLRGLIATRLVPLLGIAGGSLVYYLTLQHSHWGFDLSFNLLWLFEEDAHWVCGLEWASAA